MLFRRIGQRRLSYLLKQTPLSKKKAVILIENIIWKMSNKLYQTCSYAKDYSFNVRILNKMYLKTAHLIDDDALDGTIRSTL